MTKASLSTVWVLILVSMPIVSMLPSTIAQDTISPEVTITSPKDGSLIEGNMVTLKGTTSDADSGVKRLEYKTDEEDTWFHIMDKPKQPEWSIGIGFQTEGSHNITVRAKDNEGNKGTATITVDVRFKAKTDPQMQMFTVIGLIIIIVILVMVTGLVSRSKEDEKKISGKRRPKKKGGSIE